MRARAGCKACFTPFGWNRRKNKRPDRKKAPHFGMVLRYSIARAVSTVRAYGLGLDPWPQAKTPKKRTPVVWCCGGFSLSWEVKPDADNFPEPPSLSLCPKSEASQDMSRQCLHRIDQPPAGFTFAPTQAIVPPHGLNKVRATSGRHQKSAFPAPTNFVAGHLSSTGNARKKTVFANRRKT